MLGLQVYKDRRCSTCTLKDQKRLGCEEDISPFFFDGEKITRCPLRDYKENPSFYNDLFRLYSFREKNVMAEAGGFYDQPNYYIDVMTEMDSALADIDNTKDGISKEEDKKTQELAARGIIFTPK